MSTTSVTPPPPPAVIYGGVHRTPSQYPSAPSSSSIITVITIIASAIIISGSIYLLLWYLSRRLQPFFSAEDGGAIPGRSMSSNQQQRHVPPRDLIDSLPLFTFRSITPSITAGGDCAVCLSKFEPHDQLRLLPLCCHAFHAACIDMWIVSNQTCPLCRSTVLPSGTDALDKILSTENRGKIANGSTEGGGSFRIEIGNISRRRTGVPETAAPEGERPRRTYSVGGGTFEYIVGEDNAFQVSLGHTTHSRQFSDLDSNDKSAVGVSMPPGEVLDAEVSGWRNLLRECVDRLASISSSSRTMSFRSSGRFFSGSSHRSEAAAIVDLEAYRAGEEISEIFRWLSAV